MPGQKWAKVLLSETPKLARIVLSFSKDDLELLVRFLTGHAAVKYHLKIDFENPGNDLQVRNFAHNFAFFSKLETYMIARPFDIVKNFPEWKNLACRETIWK